jgi:uncharacterized protein (UPF0548 family)
VCAACALSVGDRRHERQSVVRAVCVCVRCSPDAVPARLFPSPTCRSSALLFLSVMTSTAGCTTVGEQLGFFAPTSYWEGERKERDKERRVRARLTRSAEASLSGLVPCRAGRQRQRSGLGTHERAQTIAAGAHADFSVPRPFFGCECRRARRMKKSRRAGWLGGGALPCGLHRGCNPLVITQDGTSSVSVHMHTYIYTHTCTHTFRNSAGYTPPHQGPCAASV